MSAKSKKKSGKQASVAAKQAVAAKLPEFEPLQASFASDADYPTTRRRRNVVAITEREYKYKNIEDGLTPFTCDKNYNGESYYSLHEIIVLCQKAYWNYGPLRNITELKVDFSSTDIYLKGSTAKIRKFFQAWFNKIGLPKLSSQFFREYYRSGNVFFYPYKAKLKESDLRSLVKLYGGKTSTASAILPVRYIILNPADIQVTGALSIGNNQVFYKRISDFELESLKNPRNEADKQVFDSLSPVIQEQIKSNGAGVLIPLPMKDISYIAFCKTDYEPFATPPIFPVLEDINYKLELKKIDMALSRSVQNSMLLVTMGEKADENGGGINQNNIVAMQKLLENNTVSRSIVSDYTTKAQFINPDIGELLNPEKYTIVNEDINTSLNNILVGGEKFANQKNKIDVFIAQLEQGRKVFLNEFLVPEMTKIAEEMGFEDSVPMPYFDEITLQDDVSMLKVYTRLMELGVITPEAGLEAINSGRLPTSEELLEAQKGYKKARDDGFYEPLVGGSNRNETGRPSGTKGIPQSTKKIGQIGSGESVADMEFDLEKIAANLSLSGKLDILIKKKLKSKFKLKELSSEQEALIPEIKTLVVANSTPDKWVENVEVFCDRPVDNNKERVSQIFDVAIKHQIDTFMAAILFASKKQ